MESRTEMGRLQRTASDWRTKTFQRSHFFRVKSVTGTYRLHILVSEEKGKTNGARLGRSGDSRIQVKKAKESRDSRKGNIWHWRGMEAEPAVSVCLKKKT